MQSEHSFSASIVSSVDSILYLPCTNIKVVLYGYQPFTQLIDRSIVNCGFRKSVLGTSGILCFLGTLNTCLINYVRQ
jgi:hypothetical protein